MLVLGMDIKGFFNYSDTKNRQIKGKEKLSIEIRYRKRKQRYPLFQVDVTIKLYLKYKINKGQSYFSG